MSILGSVLGAVAGPLVSGLFGGGSTKTTTSSSVNYYKMRKRAEGAGFNPLTALKNGGAAGFSTQTTTAPPALSSADFIGQALSQGVQTWFNRDQIARDQEAESLKLATMREELKSLQKRNKMPATFGYSIPQITTAATDNGVNTLRVAPRLSAPAAAPAKKRAAKEPGVVPPPDASAVKIAGRTVEPDTGWSDAGVITERYGEPAEWLYSPMVMGADAVKNLSTPALFPDVNWKKWGADLVKEADEKYRKRKKPVPYYDHRKARHYEK